MWAVLKILHGAVARHGHRSRSMSVDANGARPWIGRINYYSMFALLQNHATHCPTIIDLSPSTPYMPKASGPPLLPQALPLFPPNPALNQPLGDLLRRNNRVLEIHPKPPTSSQTSSHTQPSPLTTPHSQPSSRPYLNKARARSFSHPWRQYSGSRRHSLSAACVESTAPFATLGARENQPIASAP